MKSHLMKFLILMKVVLMFIESTKVDGKSINRPRSISSCVAHCKDIGVGQNQNLEIFKMSDNFNGFIDTSYLDPESIDEISRNSRTILARPSKRRIKYLRGRHDYKLKDPKVCEERLEYVPLSDFIPDEDYKLVDESETVLIRHCLSNKNDTHYQTCDSDNESLGYVSHCKQAERYLTVKFAPKNEPNYQLCCTMRIANGCECTRELEEKMANLSPAHKMGG